MNKNELQNIIKKEVKVFNFKDSNKNILISEIMEMEFGSKFSELLK